MNRDGVSGEINFHIFVLLGNCVTLGVRDGVWSFVINGMFEMAIFLIVRSEIG